MSTVTPAPGPASDEAALPADAVEVGRVVGAWGVKGGFRVKPFAADVQALFSSKRWFLEPSETPRPVGTRGAAAWPRPLRVIQAREHGDGVVATAHDIADRNAAESLQGARVFVSRASFPTPGEDEFYWIDLIGLEVHNREGVHLGRVVDLIETGPHCVMRLQAPASPAGEPADEVLIPFVSAYVDRVDLPGRCVVVDWQTDY